MASKYFVRYEGNNSKRWNGKVIQLEGEWLESLYSTEELIVGAKVVLPWQGKAGSVVQEWNAVIVEPEDQSPRPKSSASSAPAGTTKDGKF